MFCFRSSSGYSSPIFISCSSELGGNSHGFISIESDMTTTSYELICHVDFATLRAILFHQATFARGVREHVDRSACVIRGEPCCTESTLGVVLLWRTFRHFRIESCGLFDIFVTKFSQHLYQRGLHHAKGAISEAKDLFLRAFAGGFANMGGSGEVELHETGGFCAAWMVEPKSWNTKKYIYVFFSAKEPSKKWLSQIPVPGFMMSYLPAEICAGIATISVRVADVLKHTAVNLELIDTRDLANVKKMSLDLLYWILRNHTSLFIGGIIVQYYCIQQYVPWWESLWKSTSLHPSQDWTGCHVCVQSFISKLGQRNWWHHAQQHPQQHRNRRCFGTGYFERWWFKKCLAVSLWKFPRQHMWVQTKQMPDKKFPGWSMKSIWYWLTGKKCLGNKNGCDEHEVTVRTFCFTKTDPGKTLGNRWRGLLSKHICARDQKASCA